MQLNTKIITKNLLETKKLAHQLAQDLKSPIVIALEGDLGSGKTTFLQGLAEGLGIKEKVNSPTFNIIRRYELNPKLYAQFGLKYFYHFDVYRLNGPQDLEALGWEEILNDQNSIVAVEWSEKIKEIIPQKHILIQLKHRSESNREIIISK